MRGRETEIHVHKCSLCVNVFIVHYHCPHMCVMVILGQYNCNASLWLIYVHGQLRHIITQNYLTKCVHTHTAADAHCGQQFLHVDFFFFLLFSA